MIASFYIALTRPTCKQAAHLPFLCSLRGCGPRLPSPGHSVAVTASWRPSLFGAEVLVPVGSLRHTRRVEAPDLQWLLCPARHWELVTPSPLIPQSQSSSASVTARFSGIRHPPRFAFAAAHCFVLSLPHASLCFSFLVSDRCIILASIC